MDLVVIYKNASEVFNSNFLLSDLTYSSRSSTASSYWLSEVQPRQHPRPFATTAWGYNPAFLLQYTISNSVLVWLNPPRMAASSHFKATFFNLSCTLSLTSRKFLTYHWLVPKNHNFRPLLLSSLHLPNTLLIFHSLNFSIQTCVLLLGTSCIYLMWLFLMFSSVLLPFINCSFSHTHSYFFWPQTVSYSPWSTSVLPLVLSFYANRRALSHWPSSVALCCLQNILLHASTEVPNTNLYEVISVPF